MTTTPDNDEEEDPVKNDDPEEYFADKMERKKEHGSYRLSEWERLNPHVPYGGNTFNYY